MHKLRFLTFWSINAPLELRALVADLRAFRDAGFDGVVFHPRFYPGQPPYLGKEYLNVVSRVILAARDLGLAFWIYDENGWPSGIAGGEMLRLHPKNRQQWAGLYNAPPQRAEDLLACFWENGATRYIVRRFGEGVDYLSRTTARAFIALTHERYRDGLAPEAFAHVEAFFCDEPEFGLGHSYDALPAGGAIPWTPGLPELFYARHGRDLMPLLPQLFSHEKSAAIARTRVQFWSLLAGLLRESFVAPLNDWCRSHGKIFTAHVKGEEHPFFQVPMIGSNHRILAGMALPGIDALERAPANNFFPRQAASVAAQFGNGRAMCEAFGGSGWGARPGDLERYLLWLARAGITDFVMHLSQHRLDSAAICDWPPSQPLHLNWREAYPHVLRRVRETMCREAQAARAPDVLVVVPCRAIMGAFEPRELMATNIHNARSYPRGDAGRMNDAFMKCISALDCAGMAYHVIDEETLEESGCMTCDGKLRVGNRTYAHVLPGGDVVLPDVWHQRLALLKTVEFSSKPQTPQATPARGEIEPHASAWQVVKPAQNALLLEPAKQEPFRYKAVFEVMAPLDVDDIEIHFADAVVSASLNARHLALHASGHCTVSPVPAALLGGENTLYFELKPDANADAAPASFAWVRGTFGVYSKTRYENAMNGCIRTLGPFFLAPCAALPDTELVSSGFPFLSGAFWAETCFALSAPACEMTLQGIQADVAHVAIDGEPLGWLWGPDWRWEFAAPLDAGSHKMRLEIVPSTYNHYGPHHLYQGDAHAISPMQFEGRKNFADPDDAPGQTRVDAWHFKPLRFPSRVDFVVARASRP